MNKLINRLEKLESQLDKNLDVIKELDDQIDILAKSRIFLLSIGNINEVNKIDKVINDIETGLNKLDFTNNVIIRNEIKRISEYITTANILLNLSK